METIGNIFNLFTQAMDTSFLDIRNVGIDLLFLSVFTVAACWKYRREHGKGSKCVPGSEREGSGYRVVS